ncbi:MAG TPA: pseudouridine synthase [Candidatus Moranbacteria bacterium]|nr:pseudouridine synthase [Candidatus Moranbacteria bacterium]HRZ33712.1 pseudouridine synthase [Candidatus Moranbacteria bacterium]
MNNTKQINKIDYPIRINRYLALHNYCSRREADGFITKGIVEINGKKARIGDKVYENDKVKVDLKVYRKVKEYVYLAYNKPKGELTNQDNQTGKKIKDGGKFPEDIFPIGRLDKISHGLIILSNDGRITDKLLNPNRNHEKEYVIKVNKPIKNIFLKIMSVGVQLEDFKTKPCIINKKDDFTFNIILTEGKKHQIRRMCDNLGWGITDLRRIRIMNIKLGNLGLGHYRKIQGKELEEFLKKLEIK